MAARILSLDAGSSSLKAMLFDERGKVFCSESVVVPLIRKRYGVVERDLGKVWQAVREVLSRMSSRAGGDIRCVDVVCVTGAGDGLILLDAKNKLVRPAITSLDTRASLLVEHFKQNMNARDLYTLTGEIPYPGTALALLKWLRQNERASYNRACKIIFLKDWVRYRLTGEICTDLTDASATLTDVSGLYRKEIFEAFGLPDLINKTVGIRKSHDSGGKITRRAAAETGLKQGTSVVCGLHDCSASSLGSNCTKPGDTCLILGSWCGNQIVTNRPILNERHPDRQLLRNYAMPGHWLIISASPTSLVNLDWFLSTFMSTRHEDLRGASSNYGLIDRIVQQATGDGPIYHPYLYGSQTSEAASASFFGLRPWHNLGHLLKAIFEGIAINHSIHCDVLEENLRIRSVSACGGGTRSSELVQTIADALGRRIRLYSSPEITALGAAITAAVGIGLYSSFPDACRVMSTVQQNVSPRRRNVSLMQDKRHTFTKLYDRLAPFWQ